MREPGGPVDLLWATVLRRFRDHVHDTGPDPDARRDAGPDPDPEDRR